MYVEYIVECVVVVVVVVVWCVHMWEGVREGCVCDDMRMGDIMKSFK